MHGSLTEIVDVSKYPLHIQEFRLQCKHKLDRNGVLVLRNFLKPEAIFAIRDEAEASRQLAYYTVDKHNVYLTPADPEFAPEHPRNRLVSSSKGCITTDQVAPQSPLRTLYDASLFRDFLCSVLGQDELHEYADAMSSINLHYADQGQELGWHFDNSSFAITLLIQEPESGGVFEYVKDVRSADRGEMNYSLCGRVLDGEITPTRLRMDAGTLVLFRGRNSMHRVTPVAGEVTRLLVVLAYNTEPGIALSESARMTFFGRLE